MSKNMNFEKLAKESVSFYEYYGALNDIEEYHSSLQDAAHNLQNIYEEVHAKRMSNKFIAELFKNSDNGRVKIELSKRAAEESRKNRIDEEIDKQETKISTIARNYKELVTQNGNTATDDLPLIFNDMFRDAISEIPGIQNNIIERFINLSREEKESMSSLETVITTSSLVRNFCQGFRTGITSETLVYDKLIASINIDGGYEVSTSVRARVLIPKGRRFIKKIKKDLSGVELKNDTTKKMINETFDLIDEVQTAISVVTQDSMVDNRLLLLSINPQDFHTLSSNNKGWSSCSAPNDWDENSVGSYGIAQHPQAVMAFITDGSLYSKAGLEVPDKIWRKIFFLGDNGFFEGVGYPFNAGMITDEVIRALDTLYRTEFDNEPNEATLSASSGMELMYPDFSWGSEGALVYDGSNSFDLTPTLIQTIDDRTEVGFEWEEMEGLMYIFNNEAIVRCDSCESYINREYDMYYQLQNSSDETCICVDCV